MRYDFEYTTHPDEAQATPDAPGKTIDVRPHPRRTYPHVNLERKGPRWLTHS